VIKINQISKSYFTRELFTDVTFQMNAGDRLGLVGRNGHGKSTLFKLILGEEELDSGDITIPRNYRIGYLEQHLHFTQPTILDEAALGLPEEEAHSIYKAEAILFGLGFSQADLEKAPGEFPAAFKFASTWRNFCSPIRTCFCSTNRPITWTSPRCVGSPSF
jgi:ATP-binding cassette subfamily F protein 3